MPKILFRADGGPDVGMGHLQRCRALAFHLQEVGFEVAFVGMGIPESGFSGFDGKPLPCIPLVGKAQPGAGVTGMSAREAGADLVIVDSYSFSEEDFLELRRMGFPLIAIDDLADRRLPVDMVVNPNPLFPETPYREQGIPVVVTGYPLLRPELRDLTHQPGDPGNRRVFISMGGGDVRAPVLRILMALPNDLDCMFQVSVTSQCPLDELREWESADPDSRHVNSDSATMVSLMVGANAAITGGGTTLWELYSVGIPSIVFPWVPNQRNSIHVVERSATSVVFDRPEKIASPAFAETLRDMLERPGNWEDMVKRQRQLVGKGENPVPRLIRERFFPGMDGTPRNMP